MRALLATLLLAAPAPDLVWHAETVRGEVLQSRDADEPLNPASVLKVATTLWALEELGPGRRFDTRFRITDAPDGDGVLPGDLLVEGGGDPDFHPENAFLVAAELNRAGVRQVTGRLLVSDRFWIGWEGGSERREIDPAARAVTMAARLREALDPVRWPPAVRATWEEFAGRRGLDRTDPPAVVVRGGVGRSSGGGEAIVEHRSKPLPVALRRFNAYSNNDIERIGELLGGPAVLEAWLLERLDAEPDTVRVKTASGLGSNVLTARLMVRLLKELRLSCDRMGLRPDHLLPVAGCDPGTLQDSFPRLSRGTNATAVAGKTGTLVRTDGGVATLAGYARTIHGEHLFAIAAPAAGGRILEARHAQESWVLDLLGDGGGPHPRTCPPPLPLPDQGAQVTPLRRN